MSAPTVPTPADSVGGSTSITIELPLPLDVSGQLLRAIGSIYPHAQIQTNPARTHTLVVEIPDSDRFADIDGDLDAETTGDPAFVPAAPITPDAEMLLTSVRDGSFGMSAPEFLMSVLAGLVSDVLDDPAALNYVEIPALRPDGTCVTVTACRSEAQTPHQLRLAAETRADRCAAALRALGVDPDQV